VDESDILEILKGIQKHAALETPEEVIKSALDVYSSLKRSEWALARKELVKVQIEKNASALLQIIDSALFVLVLDDFTPSDIHSVASNMLHDTTWQTGSCLNRWYDKLQLIVCKDGTGQPGSTLSIPQSTVTLHFDSSRTCLQKQFHCLC
jgi:carnitine O-acetyltransferase